MQVLWTSRSSRSTATVRLTRRTHGEHGPPQQGLQLDTMALITSDRDAMRSPIIKWP